MKNLKDIILLPVISLLNLSFSLLNFSLRIPSDLLIRIELEDCILVTAKPWQFGIRASVLDFTIEEKMADGTRMKNFETQLQHVNSTMSELQSRMGQVEARGTQNQEAIRAMDSRMEGALEGMGQRLEGME